MKLADKLRSKEGHKALGFILIKDEELTSDLDLHIGNNEVAFKVMQQDKDTKDTISVYNDGTVVYFNSETMEDKTLDTLKDLRKILSDRLKKE